MKATRAPSGEMGPHHGGVIPGTIGTTKKKARMTTRQAAAATVLLLMPFQRSWS